MADLPCVDCGQVEYCAIASEDDWDSEAVKEACRRLLVGHEHICIECNRRRFARDIPPVLEDLPTE